MIKSCTWGGRCHRRLRKWRKTLENKLDLFFASPDPCSGSAVIDLKLFCVANVMRCVRCVQIMLYHDPLPDCNLRPIAFPFHLNNVYEAVGWREGNRVQKNLLFSRNENCNDGDWRGGGGTTIRFFSMPDSESCSIIINYRLAKKRVPFFPLSASNGRESLFSMEFRAENYSFVTDTAPLRIVNGRNGLWMRKHEKY